MASWSSSPLDGRVAVEYEGGLRVEATAADATLRTLYASWGIEPILEALGEPLGGYAHTEDLDMTARGQLAAVVELVGKDAVLAFFGEGC